MPLMLPLSVSKQHLNIIRLICTENIRADERENRKIYDLALFLLYSGFMEMACLISR